MRDQVNDQHTARGSTPVHGRVYVVTIAVPLLLLGMPLLIVKVWPATQSPLEAPPFAASAATTGCEKVTEKLPSQTPSCAGGRDPVVR